jgi:dihydrofolate synthase/folylpolyglutamate synthase
MTSESDAFERLTDDILNFASPGIRPGLERTSRLLARLGSPEKKFPAIQILGTNGKGSTAATIESICKAAGMRTALYTSPHLASLQERLRIGGGHLPAEVWRAAFMRAARAIESDDELNSARPTFFEILTAICFLMTSESNVDVAVVEAGMGGRYDATSTAGAIAVVVTPIGMDHMEYLGDTLEAIASEKFAAVKGGVSAFYAADDDALSLQFFERCESVGAPCFSLSHIASPENIRCSLDGVEFDYVGASTKTHDAGEPRSPSPFRLNSLNTPLAGIHQAYNASNAISTLLTLKKNYPAFGGIGEQEIRGGLRSVDWPGRMEVFSKADGSATTMLDGAHNEHAFRVLAMSLRSMIDSGAVSAVSAFVFAVMRDKDIAPMVECLKTFGAPVYCTQLRMERAMPAGDLASFLESAGCMVAGAFDYPMAAADAAASCVGKGGLVVCCGSLYLVGALRLGFAQRGVFPRPSRFFTSAEKTDATK